MAETNPLVAFEEHRRQLIDGVLDDAAALLAKVRGLRTDSFGPLQTFSGGLPDRLHEFEMTLTHQVEILTGAFTPPAQPETEA